jgi:glycosyltransferase involved in cell wall biosynthesis
MTEPQRERPAAAESAAIGARCAIAACGPAAESGASAACGPAAESGASAAPGAIAARGPAAAPGARDRSSTSIEHRRPAHPLPLVLHLVTDLRLGGTQAILLERVRRPGPFRHAVLCFSAHSGGRQAAEAANLVATFGHLGVPVHPLGIGTAAEAVVAALTGRLVQRVDEVLAGTQPSLIHSTLFHVHLLGAWMAHRAGVPHIASKEGIDDWMGPFQRWLESRALRGAARVTAVSQATARVVRRLGVETSRIEVIPNGIDPAQPGGWVVPSPASAGRGKTAIPSSEDCAAPSAGPHLLGVGRLDPVKGWDDLLDAMAALQASHPGIRLDLLGSGTEAERSRLYGRAASLGLTERLRIREEESAILEPVEEEDAVVGGAVRQSLPSDPGPSPWPILVVPSREEGFGLVLLEGMARGLSIVATRAGGIPEVARHDIEAILVPPCNPPALAEAIARMHADPALARRLAQGGRTRLAAFPAATMVDAYHRLYAEMLDPSGAPRPGTR